MGNYLFLNNYEEKKCCICNYNGSSEIALLKIYSKYSIYNNQIICTNCYTDTIAVNINVNEINKKYENKKCEWCKKTSDEIDVFKIFWIGKYNLHFMCYKCLFSKEHRYNKN
jgi:hypothetical protein